MLTARFRWLFALSAVGTLLGLLRGQEVLALISLSILLWISGEWLLFRIRFMRVNKSLGCQRWVGESTNQEGTLWVQRPTTIRLQVSSNSLLRTPPLRITDFLSEKLELVEQSNSRDGMLSRSNPLEFTYTAQPRAAGTVEFPGVCLAMFDLHGLFFAEAFLPCQQQFRVLPMPVRSDGPRSHMKLSSALPPPGIHRLQKAGMGGELLDLREYVPGDPPKSIAWKVSARRDCLMIRQHESEVPIRTTLLVDHSQSTRYGAFGWRPIDQLILLAATIAQSSLTVRDPVGLSLIDERSAQVFQPGGGNRQYFRLLSELSRAAGEPVTGSGYLTQEQLQRAWLAAQALYPELMRRGVNRVPFFLFPLAPAARFRRFKRAQLAALFTELYALPVASAVTLTENHSQFAAYAQRFLAQSGGANTSRVSGPPEHHAAKLTQFTKALLGAVSRGRDNEVFVLLIDLLDHADDLGELGKALAMAAARHHRVIVICPWPDWLGPRKPLADDASAEPLSLEQMLYEGERIRLTKSADALARAVRRTGASIAFAADPKVTQLVLAQADLVRSGRASTV